MYSSGLIAWTMWILCDAIAVNRHHRDIYAKTKIELNPVLISCELNDMAVISAPEVDCNPTYYLYRPSGEYTKVEFEINSTKDINENLDLINEVLFKKDRQIEYPKNTRIINKNYEFENNVIYDDKARSRYFFMGPFTVEDHGNWMLSVYCKDVDDNWIEMFQTITVEINEDIPLKLSNPHPRLGDTITISFIYPIKDLETCELIAPRSTFDRYYDRSKSELDECGYIVNNITLQDSGLWTVVGVGKIVYRGVVDLKVYGVS